jgi:leucyl-tRNA synthetase
MIELANELMRHKDTELVKTTTWREAVETLVLLLAPSAPHISEEMWEMLGREYSVHTQPWPAWDEALTIDDQIEIVIQVNGKPRDRITVPNGIEEAEVRQLAMSSEKVSTNLAGREPRKVIYVPGRLVNIVG